MSFKDHFSRQSAAYSRYRPAYPSELIEYVAAQAPGRRVDIHLTPSQASDLRKAVSGFLSALPAGARVVMIAVGARVVEDRAMPDGREVMKKRLGSVRGAISTGRGEELISDQEAYDIFIRHDAVVEDLVTRRIVRLDLADEIEKSYPYGERGAMLRAVTETRARAAVRYDLMVRRSKATLGALRNTLQWQTRVKGGKTVVLASRGFMHSRRRPISHALHTSG